MTRRNLTLQLDEAVIRDAKVLAARRGTSVSGLVAHEIRDLVARETRYEEARRRAEEIMSRPARRGGRDWRRDELHDG